MTDITTLITSVNLLTVVKLIVFFVIIAHAIGILIVEKQIHQIDRVGTVFTHKLIEMIGYINIILLALIVILLLLPI